MATAAFAAERWIVGTPVASDREPDEHRVRPQAGSARDGSTAAEPVSMKAADARDGMHKLITAHTEPTAKETAVSW
jgi:hypothetical protein